MRPFPIPLLTLLLAGCAAPAANTPSLAPRAAEAIDPRLPVPDTSASLPPDPALIAELNALAALAERGQGEADGAIAAAEAAASRAGPRQSESWIAAQQLLSAAVAARYPVTRALSDMDERISQRVRSGGLVPAEVDAARAAFARASEVDERQAGRIAAIQARLGS